MVSRPLNILLTNDDGFDSPYLHMLCEAAAKRGHHVTVVAPLHQQSGKSQAFTMTPLVYHERSMDGTVRAFDVDGTPADCCRAGFRCLCCGRPDLVISGMNKGYNMGMATFVSGTVGAAREAANNGFPALAVSVHDHVPQETARRFAEWAVRLGERMLDFPMPKHAVININVPDRMPEDLLPAVLCPLNEVIYHEALRDTVGPDGVHTLEICDYMDPETPDPGSDLDMLNRGHISVTVLTPSGCAQEDFAALADFGSV